MNELDELIKRYVKMLDYEKYDYLTDSEEAKEWAEVNCLKIINRIDELLKQLPPPDKQKYLRKIKRGDVK